MATTLDPQLLQQILAMQNDPRYSRGTDGNRVSRWIAPEGDPLADYQLVNRQEQQFAGPNEEGSWGPGKTYIYKDLKQNGLIDILDDKGNFLSREKGANPGNELMTAIALMAGGYYGGGALADAYGAAGAGAGSGAGAGLTGWDAAMADAAASGSLTPSSFGAAGTAGAAGSAGSAAGGMGGSAASAAGSAGSMLGDAAKAIGSNGSLLGAGLGAVAGALDGKDKTQSSNRDPWAPSQDFLKQLLGQGSALSTKYQQQPFSQAQQTAYGNMGGLLDAINANAGGLIGGFGANASGANQFQRGQPRQLQGSSMSLNGFAPGLLGSFGTRG